jgi:hypothetical protein
VFSATELNQFFKLPILFEHFSEHKTENKNITFLQFLKIHYQGNHAPDSDDLKDKRLPFKSHGNSFSTQIFAVLPAFSEIEIPVFSDNNKSVALQKNQFIPTLQLESIWQPPKYC